VAMESQPVALTSVSLYVPAAVMLIPFHRYGRAFAHIVVLVVLVTTGFTTRISVAMESQPVALTNVSLYVPAVVMLMPFQRYGKAFAHIVVLVVLVTACTDS
jgi:hypothetical protein